MAKYNKSLSYICFILLALAVIIACKPQSRQDTAQTCVLDQKVKTSIEAEKPISCVVIDDKALTAFVKQKATAVYCIAMGAS